MRKLSRLSARLADETAERVRRNHEQRLTELQSAPALSGRLIRNVLLPSATVVQVSHGLGRPALAVFPSAVRDPVSPFSLTTGRIEQIRDSGYDASKVIALRAQGWGVTIEVDLWVM